MSNNTKNSEINITNSAIIRIGKDVKDILKTPVDNCFYIHSSRIVSRGYAVIFGADDTPYFGVPMFYKLDFPYDYPHSPPKMKFLSYSKPTTEYIRLHPNYYVNGKCCLSILNTWSGDKWTGCQTIRSLMTSIAMTLTDDPIKNEPGMITDPSYTAIVANAGLYFLATFLQHCENTVFDSENVEENIEIRTKFYNYVVDYVKQNKKMLMERLTNQESILNKWINPYDNVDLNIKSYNLRTRINFKNTREKLIDVINNIKDNISKN